jgi:hypothetical protein
MCCTQTYVPYVLFFLNHIYLILDDQEFCKWPNVWAHEHHLAIKKTSQWPFSNILHGNYIVFIPNVHSCKMIWKIVLKMSNEFGF